MDMRRLLIISGLIIVVLGIMWPWIIRIPLGRMPGDLILRRRNFIFYFPIASSVVLSLVATLILWLFRK